MGYSKLHADYGKCDTLPFVNASGSTILGGTTRIEGEKFGIVYDVVLDTETGVMMVGVPAPGIDIPKATGFAPAIGEPAYWDIADEDLNADSANPVIGHYYAAAATGATVAVVVLTNQQNVA